MGTVVINRTNTAVVVRQSSQALVSAVQRSTVSVEAEARAVVTEQVQRVVEVGVAGPQGIPGETEGATFTAPAGETIHGGRVVRLANGQVFHPSLANNDHASQVAGVAVNSATAGQNVLVRAAGQMTEGYWTWAPGAVWCGIDGQLTQSPVTGWLLQVARVVDATTLSIDIETPIYRS